MQIFSNSLANLKEFAEFAPLLELALCFPEGYYTSEGYQLLLQKLYDRSQNVEQFLTQIDRYANIADLVNLIDSPFIQFFSSRWVESHATQFWQFIIDHLADLENAPLDGLWQLVDKTLSGDNVSQLETNVLLRLTNLLQRRRDAGEAAAPEDIEGAYQRLVRRYPPEFHPEKFYQIDASYTFLTSLSNRLERLSSPQKYQAPGIKNFPYELLPPTAGPEEIMAAFHRQLLFSHLWEPSPETDGKPRTNSSRLPQRKK